MFRAYTEPVQVSGSEGLRGGVMAGEVPKDTPISLRLNWRTERSENV